MDRLQRLQVRTCVVVVKADKGHHRSLCPGVVGPEADGLLIHQISFKTSKGTIHGPFGTKPNSPGITTYVSPSKEGNRGSCWMTRLVGGIEAEHNVIRHLMFWYNCVEKWEDEEPKETPKESSGNISSSRCNI